VYYNCKTDKSKPKSIKYLLGTCRHGILDKRRLNSNYDQAS
jgi:hypothetical protein